jgi:hypothetical protein
LNSRAARGWSVPTNSPESVVNCLNRKDDEREQEKQVTRKRQLAQEDRQ